jgi:pimeloyl-ACP methyl ester carboxylesterase/sugar lactone lactonase YvrE
VSVGPAGVYMSNFGASVWLIDADGAVQLASDAIQGSSGNTVMADGRLVQSSFVGGRMIALGGDDATTVLAEGLEGPVGIATDGAGDLIVCNCQGNSLSKVSLAAGTPEVRTLASNALFACPNGITRGPDGAMYVVNFGNPHVLRVDDSGDVSIVATLPGESNAHIAFAQGSLFVTRVQTNDIYRVERDGSFRHWAGSGDTGTADGPIATASLARPNGIATSADGNYLYVNTLVGEWRGEQPTELSLRRIGPIAGPDADALTPLPAAAGDVEEIEIVVGDLVFDALAAGPADGPLVLLLHGFPQTAHAFGAQLPVLGAAGFRAVAPNQRGYSPGARPEGVGAYSVPNLVTDVVGMADALGATAFDLVGHDWGGAVAWVTAALHPQRVRTLTMLSTPHVAALAAARADGDSDQARRSSSFATFAEPGAETALLANDRAALRAVYAGLDERSIERYLSALGTPEALRAALAWYAAAFGAPTGPVPSSPSSTPPPPPPITVPTTYVWSTEDGAFGREAATATAAHVAGPYRVEIIEDVGHWLPELAAEEVTRLILEQVRRPDR